MHKVHDGGSRRCVSSILFPFTLFSLNRKKGENMSDENVRHDTACGLLNSFVISPIFLRKMVREFLL